ncbi:MAG TPA: hypothetical protein VGK84_00345 [Candidatus Tumulicola sp.]|jgi:hypothetical protein
MRFRYAAVVMAVALVPGELLRSVLAGSASALFEALPFLVLAAALRRLLPPGAVAFAGCGCTPGPSARSLPAAAALWLSFGPVVALSRVLAACALARLTGPRARRSSECGHSNGANLLTELNTLVPAALGAGLLASVGSWEPARVAPWLQFAGGALVGSLAAPCGLATAALATSLHARAPLAAAGLLCTAGIADIRAFVGLSDVPADDALAYAALAIASTAIGLHRGAGFVHPTLGAALLPCAAIAIGAALRFRKRSAAALRIAPAIMLAGAFAGSPPPQYHANETTMAGLFAGERLTFTGTLSNREVLVRYAIACCRADAMPVAVRCTRRLAFADATWLRVDGTVVQRNGQFLLDVAGARRIAAPADPFVYR